MVVRATVPDVVGLRIGPASSALRASGLAVGSVTTVPGRAGVVVRTDPTPGEAVVAETPVDVFVGNGADE
jgi:beta-lactam-binding protein with PASTA domain